MLPGLNRNGSRKLHAVQAISEFSRSSASFVRDVMNATLPRGFDPGIQL
jgi:hypothetical protein